MRVSSVLFLALLAFVPAAEAGAPAPNPLEAALAALQAAPADDALRAKVIELARQAKPRPTLPVTAMKASGRGKYLMQDAKDAAGYLAAAQAFGEAIAAAPWDPAAYFNQGTAYEKGGRADLAIGSFEWYLKAAPDAPDVAAVVERIGGLELASSKQSAERERMALLQAEYSRLAGLVHGRVFKQQSTCRGCTQQMAQGSNWYGNDFVYTWTGAVALLTDANDPRVEISFAQTSADPSWNGVNNIFIGRVEPGAVRLRWQAKYRWEGKGQQRWWSEPEASWFRALPTGIQWCQRFVDSDCSRIPVNAERDNEIWANDPNATYYLTFMKPAQ